jgi:tropomyosin
MNSLRLEAEESAGKVEELQSKVKTLEQDNLQKEQDIISLTHKNSVLESEVEKFETQVKELKSAATEGQQHGTQNETLTRRLQLLEEEAEEADRTLREANEKYDGKPAPRYFILRPLTDRLFFFRLRQTDVKAGHFERKVQALEQERDQWETKYEDMSKKYAAAQKELEDFQIEINTI